MLCLSLEEKSNLSTLPYYVFKYESQSNENKVIFGQISNNESGNLQNGLECNIRVCRLFSNEILFGNSDI